MTSNDETRTRIPAASVRAGQHPVLVSARPRHGEGHGITVAPILGDDQRVAGFEVRCGCGSHVFVECVDALPAPASLQEEA